MPNHDLHPALAVVLTADHPLTQSPDQISPSRTPQPSTPDSNLAYQIARCRVIVQPPTPSSPDNESVLIVQDAPGGPAPVLQALVQPHTHFRNADRLGTSYLTTTDGRVIAYTKDSGCSCGSRLRTYRATQHLYA